MNIVERDTYIYVKATGKRTREDILEISKKTMEKCIETNKTLVLINLKGSSSDLSITETFFMGASELPELLQKSMTRVAIVEDEITDKIKFFENVVVNRGYKVKFFVSVKEAEEWIQERNARPNSL